MAGNPDVVLGEDHVTIRGSDDSSPVLEIEGENNWNLSETDGDLRIGDSSNALKMGVSLAGAGEGTGRIQATSELKLGIVGNSSMLLDGDGAHPNDSEDLGTPNTRWSQVHVENAVHVGSSYDGTYTPSEGVMINKDLTQIPRLHVSDGIMGEFTPRSSGLDLGASDSRWGTVYAESVDTPSDRRLKTEIEPLKGGLDTVLDLHPVSYAWRENGDERNIGLIGQDVAEILPEVVSEPVGEDGHIGLDYTGIVPVLVNALQEQHAELEALSGHLERQQEHIDGLEERLTALENHS